MIVAVEVTPQGSSRRHTIDTPDEDKARTLVEEKEGMYVSDYIRVRRPYSSSLHVRAGPAKDDENSRQAIRSVEELDADILTRHFYHKPSKHSHDIREKTKIQEV